MTEEQHSEEQTLEENSIANWIKENARVIVSIIIVVAIAGGIYSYSKRSQTPVEQDASQEQSVSEKQDISEKETVSPEKGRVEIQKNETANDVKDAEQKKSVTSAAISKETETSFIETAERGNGTTHLARRALANYLEKNPDSSLTPEHKIYIEDYLRKKSGFKGRVYIGTSVEFSKDLIEQAIGQSKKLNERQLKNLHKYAVKVPSLS